MAQTDTTELHDGDLADEALDRADGQRVTGNWSPCRADRP